jgi:mRNA interferase RelE/StbE
MKTIAFDPLAAKQFLRLDAAIARRIETKLRAYAAQGVGDVTAYKTRPGAMRLRIGDWRVVLTDDGENILVHLVGHRRDVYD